MSDGRNYTDEDYRQLHSAHCVTEAQRAAAVKEIERLREDWFQREKVLKDPVAVHINMLRGGGGHVAGDMDARCVVACNRRETLMHFIAIFLIVVGLLTLLKPMDH